MAIKVIKKFSAAQVAATHTISNNNIIAPRLMRFGLRQITNKNIFELTAPIKPAINIKLDAYGKPNISQINMGIQYEHYSTWMHFDLSELIWQIKTQYSPDDGLNYEEEYYYALYEFRIYFKNQQTLEVLSWEFDGIDFQIPWQITQYPGTYEIALVIREKTDDQEEGNIPDDYSPFEAQNVDNHETFISHSWFGNVTGSYFTPDLLEGIEEILPTDTSQTKALIKPAIDCSLADDGFFMLEPGMDTSLGIYNDNLIRYLRFNPGHITTHLSEFYVFAIFKQNSNIIPVAFEQTETGAYDDTTQPLIAWVPSEVYNRPGEWRIMIAAISKNYRTDDINSEEYTELFYRFLSDKITMQVDPGFIEDLKLISDADEEYYTSDFITADEQVIIGSDNAILRGE